MSQWAMVQLELNDADAIQAALRDINYHGDKPRGLPHRVVTIGQVDSGLPLRQAKLRKRVF
jgi:hypothetical protein